MLWKKIIKAQNGDKEILLELIEKFDPLLTKYARLLQYEDAYNDMIIEFIELLKKMKIAKIQNLTDGAIVNYIQKSIKNIYNRLIQGLIKQRQETETGDIILEQIDSQSFDESKQIEIVLEEWGAKKILSSLELEIIKRIYGDGYSSVEIAKEKQISRQAVNQIKIRSIKKLRMAIN